MNLNVNFIHNQEFLLGEHTTNIQSPTTVLIDFFVHNHVGG
jgi:hypothetical protein